MKPAVLLLAPLLAVASPAGAVVLWTTTFSGADGTNRNLANTAVDLSFTDTLAADDANLTFEDVSFTGTVFMHSGNMATGDHYSPRTNVDNPAAASPQNKACFGKRSSNDGRRAGSPEEALTPRKRAFL